MVPPQPSGRSSAMLTTSAGAPRSEIATTPRVGCTSMCSKRHGEMGTHLRPSPRSVSPRRYLWRWRRWLCCGVAAARTEPGVVGAGPSAPRDDGDVSERARAARGLRPPRSHGDGHVIGIAEAANAIGRRCGVVDAARQEPVVRMEIPRLPGETRSEMNDAPIRRHMIMMWRGAINLPKEAIYARPRPQIGGAKPRVDANLDRHTDPRRESVRAFGRIYSRVRRP